MSRRTRTAGGPRRPTSIAALRRIACRRAIGSRPRWAATNLGELLISQGRYEEAERVLGDARRVLRSAGFTPFAIFAEIQLARCAINRGDTQHALEVVDAHRR